MFGGYGLSWWWLSLVIVFVMVFLCGVCCYRFGHCLWSLLWRMFVVMVLLMIVLMVVVFVFLSLTFVIVCGEIPCWSSLLAVVVMAVLVVAIAVLVFTFVFVIVFVLFSVVFFCGLLLWSS